jgi:hypothetical protein
MSRKWLAAADRQGGALWGPDLTEFAGTWLIYRDFPGLALTHLAMGLTDPRVLLLPDAGRALFAGGNAVSYDAICYLAFVLRWRWKK